MAFENDVEPKSFGENDPSVNFCTFSNELSSLIDFARRLGSYNCTSEPGVVDVDEGNTREEAQLLMSLLASPACKIADATNNHSASVSSSDASNNSYESDSSLSSNPLRTPRKSFSFVCPSLSLENSQPPRINNAEFKFSNVGDTHENISSSARLLGRPLKVDDRDALRLSSDAMARNILKSFQKAITWRVESWTQALTNQLVHTEREMKKAGATVEDIKILMQTSEAALIGKLRDAANAISVTSVRTSFEVLPEKIENKGDLAEPPKKRPRAELFNDVSYEKSMREDNYDYQYSIAHVLMFHCVINLYTSAGYSEISFDVPGAIEGTFLSTNAEPEQLRSVTVNLNTNILAAMVEKSCRTVVRASVEVCMQQNNDAHNSKEELCTAKNDTVIEDRTPLKKQLAAAKRPREVVTATSTPSRPRLAPRSTPAFVTPRAECSEASGSLKSPPSSSVLMPIPDDFADGTKSKFIPRRISPQTTSPNLKSTCNDMFSSKQTEAIQQNNQCASSTTFLNHTQGKPKLTAKMTSSKRLPLISPTANECIYKEVPENGPSLPMLVEAACRARKGN